MVRTRSTSRSEGGPATPPAVVQTSADNRKISKKKKGKRIPNTNPPPKVQLKMTEYLSGWGVNKNGKKAAEGSEESNKSPKTTIVSQSVKQTVTGSGNKNINMNSQIHNNLDEEDDKDSSDHESDDDTIHKNNDKDLDKSDTQLDPAIAEIVGDNFDKLDKKAGDTQTQILKLLVTNTSATLQTRKDVNGMKRKIGANTRSIKKVRLDVKSLSSRVENLERHGARDSATASSEIMEKVLSWTNLVRNSMYRALGQIRVVGFTPTSRPSAEKLANMFLEKLFRFKRGENPPDICRYVGFEPQGKEWAIIIGAEPNLVQTMINWNSELHKLWPKEGSRTNSSVFINPELPVQFRSTNRKYVLIGRDMRAILGGHTRIKSKPESLSLQLCYKKTRTDDFRARYSFTPKHGVEIANTPIIYLDRKNDDVIAPTVLFRKSKHSKNPLDRKWVEEKLVEANEEYRTQLPDNLIPICAKDGTEIGYKFTTSDFKEGEEVFDALYEQARQEGVEITHFGKSSDDNFGKTSDDKSKE